MPGRPLLPLLLAALAAGPLAAADPEQGGDDERVLAEANVGRGVPALEEFFRHRTPSAGDTRRVADLIAQLGDDDFTRREEATRALAHRGPAAVALLEAARRSSDAEVARRAARCLEEISPELDAGLPGAAARVLVRKAPGRAAAVLLAYLPFATGDGVAGEVSDALAVLATRPGPADPALRAALADRRPAVRAVAACALGRSTDPAVRPAVRALLKDPEAGVRLGAAEGLLAGRDRQAVPVLAALAAAGPQAVRERAEAQLERLVGDGVPAPPAAAENGRPRWEAWWAENGPRIDLARLDEAPPYRGLNLVPEMHAGKVWECGKDGKPLWEVDNLQTPIDAQVLPGKRLLVAELNGGRVIEVDRGGKIFWQHAVNTPIACERLPGGNTFIATNHRVFVVSRSGREVFSYAPEAGFFIHSVQRLHNGHVVCVSMAGAVREIDAAGKEVCTVSLPIAGGWSGVEGAPGNHYLVVNNTQGKVLEVDRKGKVVWEYTTPGACYASRLPNGHTLVVSNARGLLEVDRKGTVVWSREVSTSLWRAHRR
jgi:hypothetical protein